MQKHIFNKKQLDKTLDNYKQSNINAFGKKFAILENWNRSLEERDLDKTKEESTQVYFLNEIFTKILGYESRIDADEWNINPEQKTEIDGTSADGALGFFTIDENDVRVAIELKNAKTDLDHKQNRKDDKRTPVDQAFDYQRKFSNCNWVIVSNFKEIRLYNAKTSTEYEPFFINEIVESPDDFKRFYYLLNKEHLITKSGKSKIDELYEQNEKEKKDITTNFYNAYQNIRENLFSHLKENNDISEMTIFQKTQKLLDRFIFVCFCEDTELLEDNILRDVIDSKSFVMNDTWKWEELKGLFHSIDQGNPPMNINKFNGGLFEEDEELDQLVIKNDFFTYFKEITEYDFSSDLNVNILGHIFEQSINDIEEIKASIEEEEFNPLDSKRKKDGIFYTSQGVTKFLLDETIKSWINDQEYQLGKDKLPVLTEEDYIAYNKLPKKGRKRKKMLNWEKYIDFYGKLLDKVRSIKVVDPAVGSGAFLNMAFDMLISEGEKINENLSKYQYGQVEFLDVNRYILKNNLFGVDLNPESVEISKLSLWLKTANKKDELTSLDENIRSGNSIIEDSSITSSAFNWNEQFPSIMENGGFDVLIGNPPYVFSRNQNFTDAEKDYFNANYELTEYQINTYLLFIERSYYLLNEGGWFAFIVPNTCLTITSFKKMRRFLLENTGNLKIINIYDRMFEDANVDNCFIIFQKVEPTTVKLGEYTDENVEIVAEVKPEELIDEQSIINISAMKNKKTVDLKNKIEKKSSSLINSAKPTTGLKAYQTGKGSPPQTEEMKELRVFHSKDQKEGYVPYLEGGDVKRYSIGWSGEYLSYGDHLAEPRKSVKFDQPRILVRQIPSESKYAMNAVYTDKHLLNDINSMVIHEFKRDPLFILGVLNSKIITFWFINKFDKFQRGLYPQFKVSELKLFPVPDVSEDNEKIIANQVDNMLNIQREKAKLVKKMDTVMLNELETDKLPKMFEDFYEWSSDEWLDRINKIKKLSLNEKSDWLEFFESNKQTMLSLVERENNLNQEIDQAVAKSFELTNEEVKYIDDKLEDFV